MKLLTIQIIIIIIIIMLSYSKHASGDGCLR